MDQNLKFILQTKEERDHPACHQLSVQKSASLMVLGWGISVYGTDSLHIWKGSINAERYKQALE